tara:strand:- start:31 stop:762 length:732 start_codon:yes stop_codon:yes gene_type:complete
MAQGYIYKFSLDKKEKKQVEVKRKNKETGETEIVLQNKTVKTPVEFIIKKPTRRIIDEAEAQYAVELSKNIKKGIVTKAMMIKKYADTGGALTEEQAKDMVRNLQKSNEISNKIQLLSTEKKKPTEEIEKLEAELLTIRKELAEFETAMQGVYEHTADARSERSMLLWYVIQLSRILKGEEEEFFFNGIIYEDQLEDLYKKDEEGDEIEMSALSTMMSIVSYWFYNGESTQEELDNFLKQRDA